MARNRTASYAGEVFGIGAPARLIEAAAADAGPVTMTDLPPGGKGLHATFGPPPPAS